MGGMVEKCKGEILGSNPTSREAFMRKEGRAFSLGLPWN